MLMATHVSTYMYLCMHTHTHTYTYTHTHNLMGGAIQAGKLHAVQSNVSHLDKGTM